MDLVLRMRARTGPEWAELQLPPQVLLGKSLFRLRVELCAQTHGSYVPSVRASQQLQPEGRAGTTINDGTALVAGPRDLWLVSDLMLK